LTEEKSEWWLIPLEGNLRTALAAHARLAVHQEEDADVVILTLPALSGCGDNLWNYLKKHLNVKVQVKP